MICHFVEDAPKVSVDPGTRLDKESSNAVGKAAQELITGAGLSSEGSGQTGTHPKQWCKDLLWPWQC